MNLSDFVYDLVKSISNNELVTDIDVSGSLTIEGVHKVDYNIIRKDKKVDIILRPEDGDEIKQSLTLPDLPE